VSTIMINWQLITSVLSMGVYVCCILINISKWYYKCERFQTFNFICWTGHYLYCWSGINKTIFGKKFFQESNTTHSNHVNNKNVVKLNLLYSLSSWNNCQNNALIKTWFLNQCRWIVLNGMQNLFTTAEQTYSLTFTSL